MATPTLAIIAHEPTTKMGPVPVGYSFNDATFVSGDGSLVDDCKFYWQVVGISGSDVDDVPDRYRKILDPRLMTAEAFVTFAGSTMSTLVDLFGGASGRLRNMISTYSMNYVLTEGTWSIRLTCVNPSGEFTTVAWGITVAADTRTSNTLKAAGGDHDNWDDAITWLGGADSRKLVVDNGFAGTSSMIRPNRNNFVITTADPTSSTNARATHDNVDTEKRFVTFAQNKEGSLIECLDIAPSAMSVTRKSDGFWIRGNYNAYTNCRVLNNAIDDSEYFEGSFIITSISQDLFGCTLINCESEGVSGSGNYTVSLIGANDQTCIAVQGGTFGFSANESIFRTTVSLPGVVKFISLMYGFYDNSRNQSKSTIRYARDVEFGTILGCRCLDGDISIGAQGGPDGVVFRHHCVLEGIWSTGNIGNPIYNIKEDAMDVRIRNCYAGPTGSADGINTGPDGQPSANDLNSNVRVYNCTSTKRISSAGDPDGFGLSGQEIKGCLVTSGGIKISSEAFASGAVSDNRVNGDFEYDDVTKTLAEWNALSEIGTDYEGETTLEDFAYPSTTVETMTRLDVNPTDIWGFDRDATTLIGCTNSVHSETSPPDTGNDTARPRGRGRTRMQIAVRSRRRR